MKIILLFLLLSITPILAHAQEYNYTDYDTEKYKCYETFQSGFCGLFEDPLDAISNAFLKEYLGEWYIVLIFTPFPISAIILTKNFTYGGFVGLIMTGTLNTMDPMAFDIAMYMVAVSTGMVFIDMIYKRLK